VCIGHNAAVAALLSQPVDSLLPEAVHRWQAAGVDTSGLGRDHGDGGVGQETLVASTRLVVSAESNAGTSQCATEALFALLTADDEAPSIDGSPVGWRHPKRAI
jgi:hypothetical protein